MLSWLSILSDDRFLKVATAIVGLAFAVEASTPEHTLAHKIAHSVVSVGVALGIGATVGRTRNPAPPPASAADAAKALE